MKRGGSIKRRTPLRAVSPRRGREQATYRKLRAEFLTAHPWCEARLTGCTGASTEVHHKAGRVGALFLAVEHWLAACHDCHTYLTEHPAEAYALGLSERRVS